MKHVITLCIAAALAAGCSKQETAEARLVNQAKPASSVTPSSAPTTSGTAAAEALVNQTKPSKSFK